jgi:hypothetical protein
MRVLPGKERGVMARMNRMNKATLPTLPTVEAKILFDWSDRFVNALQDEVNEGESYKEAKNFTVFLLNSGVVRILNCPALRERTERLQRSVTHRWAVGRGEARVSVSSLHAILHRLDVIAAHIGGAK